MMASAIHNKTTPVIHSDLYHEIQSKPPKTALQIIQKLNPFIEQDGESDLVRAIKYRPNPALPTEMVTKTGSKVLNQHGKKAWEEALGRTPLQEAKRLGHP